MSLEIMMDDDVTETLEMIVKSEKVERERERGEEMHH